MNTAIQQKVDQWLSGSYDDATKNEIRRLQKEQPEELADAFYKNLEFGTGGMRGLMGAGTNRINKYTIGIATQGFANYLKKNIEGDIKIAIAHDSRNNSRSFAEITAHVMAANGIKVFLFENLRPTPELSFAIRYLHCNAGVVCTASHNPKEYNGYKAYWDDGSQLVAPHDKNVIGEIEKINSIDEVKWSGEENNITLIGKDIDEAYFEMVKGLSVYPDIIKKQADLKIVYTPIHGSGIKLVPEILRRFGFNNVHIVEEQSQPDGNFPTVKYPNPEEADAMNIGLQKAKEIDADILLGTDPDADRVGIGIKNNEDEWILLNGNQTAVLAFNYLMEARYAKGVAQPTDYVCKTIVTTRMIDKIAKKYKVQCYNVLTGFKYIAALIRKKESYPNGEYERGKENYIIGGEESYGLLIGDKVRDKDAVSAVALLCEMAAYEKDKGRSLYQKLYDLYMEFDLYRESMISITKKGEKGAEEITEMMNNYRAHPPKTIAGYTVKAIHDYLKQKTTLTDDPNYTKAIGLPKSDVLQFELNHDALISIRPSGTEPKIKFYFSISMPVHSDRAFNARSRQTNNEIKNMMKDMKLIDGDE